MGIIPLARPRKYLPILPVLFLILLVGIAPFIEALRNSVFHDFYGERSFAALDNFRFILGDKAFSYSLNITVLWAFLNVILSLIFGFLLALALIGKKRSVLHGFLLIPWGIPVYIAIPLWRAFLHGNGGVSIITRLTGLRINLMMDPAAGFLGALMVSLWLSIPLTAFVFAGHMRKVNRQVIEAAGLDGAGPGALAVHIYLPEIRESLMAMGILNFIKAFKEFTLVFMMTAGGPPLMSGITDRHIVGATSTLGVFLYEVFLQTNDWGVNAAYAVIMAGLVLLAMVLWVLIRRPGPSGPLLSLSALVLIPGERPLLWIIGAGYLILSFSGKRGERWILPLVSLHLASTVFMVLSTGFLAGFHPGIMVPLLLMPLRMLEKPVRMNGCPARLGLRPNRFPQLNRGTGISSCSGTVGVLFIITTVIILYMLLWMSLSRISACYIDTFVPPEMTTENYRRIIIDEGILGYFGNTFLVAGITAALLPLLIFPAAVLLNRAGRKKTLAFLGFIQIVGISGGMHTLIPLYGIFRGLGLVNTYFPLILIYLYHSIPFSLFILTAFLENLPSSFRDLARLEGMGNLAYGFRILLPLSLPPLLTALMSAFIAAWNGFQAPLLFLNDEKLYTISLKLFGYVGSIGSGSPVWNLFAAASVLNTLFIGFIFIRFKKPMGYSPVSDFDE